MPDFIAPDQLDAAVQAGMAPVAGAVNVTTADGRVVQIDAADYGALRNEFNGVATDEQTYAYQQQQAAQARQAELQAQGGRAFGEAALASAYDQTLGLLGGGGRQVAASVFGGAQGMPADIAALSPNDPRRQSWEAYSQATALGQSMDEGRAVAEANRDAAGWGRFTGTVAGGLATSAITGGFGGLGAAGTLGKLGVAGLEGGIAGLTTAREEAFIKNEQLSSSAAWDAVQHGALFGVALGGAFAGLGAGYNALRGAGRGAQAAAEGLEAGAMGATRAGAGTAAREGAETVAAALERKADPGVLGMLKRVFSKDEEVREALEVLSSQESRQLALGGPGSAVKMSRSLKGAVNDLENAESMISNAMAMKTAGAERLVQPALVQAQKAAAPTAASQAAGALREVLDESSGGLTATMRKQVEASISQAEALGAGASEMSGGQLFLAHDGVKRSMQTTIDHLRGRASHFAREDPALSQALLKAASKIEGTETAFRKGLENEAVWGPQLATFQREFNEGWVESLSGTGKYTEKLTRKGDKIWENGRFERLADSAGVDAAVKSLGTAAADDLSEGIAQRVLGQQKMLQALEKSGLADAHTIAKTRAALDTVQQVHGTLIKHADAVRAMETLKGAGEGAASVASMLPWVGKWAASAVRPDAAVRGLAMVERHTSTTESALSGIARRALGVTEAAAEGATTGGTMGAVRGAAGSIAELARSAGRSATAPARNALANMTGVSERMRPYAKTAAVTGGVSAGFYRGADSPQQAYQSRVREVNATAAPGAAEAHAAQLLGPMGKDAPKFAAAFTQQMRTAADFLASKAPVPPDRPGELQGNRKLPLVDQRAVEKFGRYYTAVNQPMECAALLAKGQLRPEHVEALKVVHPQILQTLQNAVLQQVESMKDPIPPGRARQLDILLDLGGRADPTIKQENLRIMADVGAQRAAQAQQAPQGRGAPNLAGASATRSTELANR